MDLTALPVFAGLTEDERQRLSKLTREMQSNKSFSAAGGAVVDEYVTTIIAAFAALPVLNLGMGFYSGWREIIVYPGEFIHDSQRVDAAGVVHHMRYARSGEAMVGGPIVLSWSDVVASGGGVGYNVVIHEFAHKLDMRNGVADGLPPLHSGMKRAEWATALQSAYSDFTRKVSAGEQVTVNSYAAESPAEFFAVLSEYFFECPAVLYAAYPGVYHQFRLFFRQHPLARVNIEARGK